MPEVIGHVDGFEGQYVLGWAIAEPDIESCNVEVVDEKGRIAGAGRATRIRPDLRSLGKGRVNFGFRIPVKVGRARALHVRAAGEEIAGSPLGVGRDHWDGFIEVVNGRAFGWATERTALRDAPPIVELCDERGTILTRTQSRFDTSSDDPNFVPARFEVLLDQLWFGRGELALFAKIDGRTFSKVRANLRLGGFLDHISASRCAGWLLSPDAADRDFEIDVWVNGNHVKTARASQPRDDLKNRYPQCWRRGFDIPLAITMPLDELTEISLRLSGSRQELFDGPFIVGERTAIVTAARKAAALSLTSSRLNTQERSVLRAALGEFIRKHRHSSESVMLKGVSAPTTPQSITVIIPVYRGLDITRDCIESVLRHRDAVLHRMLIVNDYSPEPGMADLLSGYQREPGFVLLNNERNLGFVKTVNRALDCVGEGDVILLNSDTRVFDGWLDELMRVAYASADIGTVTALSNNATIFSYPHPTLACATLDDVEWPELAATALRENAGRWEQVPTGHGFCLLIKREVLERVGHLDERYDRGYGEENHLCCLAADLGYRNVAAAGVLVEHRENVSFGDERGVLWERNRPQLEAAFPEYTPQVMAYEAREGLRRARWALDKYRLEKASHGGRGFALIIRNWLGGGCDTAIEDLKGTIDPELVHMTLSTRDDGYMLVTCASPALYAVFAAGEEDAIVDLLSAAGVKLVLCHQLLGFSAAFIERFGEWAKALPSVYYLHDFYSFCPRVNLIDATGRFCDVPDVQVCERCVKAGGAHEASHIEELTVEAHRDLFSRVLATFDRVISPSENAAGYFRRVFPDIDVTVIPHPQTLWQFPDKPREGSPHDIVLLGAIGPHKGSSALLEIASRARLTHPRLHFHVVGYTNIDEELLALGNVTITGKYTAEELPRLVDQTGGCVALFLHGWPETFSYALTEAVALGLTPLVPSIGAPADRVRGAGYGMVFSFPFNARTVLETMDTGSTDRNLQSLGALDPRNFATSHEANKPASADLRSLANALSQSPKTHQSRRGDTKPSKICL